MVWSDFQQFDDKNNNEKQFQSTKLRQRSTMNILLSNHMAFPDSATTTKKTLKCDTVLKDISLDPLAVEYSHPV